MEWTLQYIFSCNPIYKFITSVCDWAQRSGRPGPAQHSRSPGFWSTGPAVGGVGLSPSQKADRARPGWPEHRASS